MSKFSNIYIEYDYISYNGKSIIATKSAKEIYKIQYRYSRLLARLDEQDKLTSPILFANPRNGKTYTIMRNAQISFVNKNDIDYYSIPLVERLIQYKEDIDFLFAMFNEFNPFI